MNYFALCCEEKQHFSVILSLSLSRYLYFNRWKCVSQTN